MQKQETCAQELRYVKQRAAYRKKGEWEKWMENRRFFENWFGGPNRDKKKEAL